MVIHTYTHIQQVLSNPSSVSEIPHLLNIVRTFRSYVPRCRPPPLVSPSWTSLLRRKPTTLHVPRVRHVRVLWVGPDGAPRGNMCRSAKRTLVRQDPRNGCSVLSPTWSSRGPSVGPGSCHLSVRLPLRETPVRPIRSTVSPIQILLLELNP